MYAINHAATALVVKKQYPSLPVLPLLIAVQFVEVLWVIFNTSTSGSPTLAWGPEVPAAVWSGPPSLVRSYKVRPSRVMTAVMARADIAASAGARPSDRWHPHEVALDQLERVQGWQQPYGTREAFQPAHGTRA